ncbi:hypothetical protein ACOMHN_034480 [Nucella lapillus]
MGKSDHFTLFIKLNHSKSKPPEQKMFNFPKADFDRLRADLQETNWDSELTDLSVDEMWKVIKSKIENAVQQSVPLKSVGRARIKKWMDRKTLESVRKKHRLFRRWQQTQEIGDYTAYLKARNKASRECRKAKRNLEATVAAEAKNNPKVFWSYVKSKTTTRSGIGDLKKENGSKTTSDQEKAELLNNFFHSVFTHEDDGPLPDPPTAEYSTTLEDFEISEEKDFSIKHGGMDDIKRHVGTKNHQKKGSERANEKLTRFGFGPAPKSAVDYSTIRAETLFVSFLVEHNIPLSAADHAGPLFRKMFPNCKTAQEFKCARTKATAITKCLAKLDVEDSANQMKSGPFVIGTDGSQEGGEKNYPIMVRFCDSNGYIQSKLLANPTSTDSSTGENIFHLLDDTLTSLGIDWTKCLSLVCDNAATMTGLNKGVISYVRKKTPKVHLAGCVCHLLNLAAKKATKAFQGEFDFDDILRQISWYMSQSTNREQRLKKLQKQCGTPELNVIDHCPTRWLSMGLALRRLLQQWKPLQMFFEEECKKDIKGKSEEEKKRSSIRTRVHDFLKRSTAKLYALFLSFAMESFDILNQELQTDAAKIHVVKRSLEQFYRKLLISFVKPSALSSGTLLAVDFTAKYNMKDSKDILIGTATKQHISGLRDKVAEQFMKDVISFYQAACTYLKAKVFPVGEPLWKHAQVADIKLKETALFSSLDYFMERFPCLLPHEVGEDESPQEALTRAKDQLQAEFTDYQSWEVPSHLMTEEKVATEQLWAQITKVKDCNEAMRFQVLPRVMLGILLLPVSNAACERVFSVARRNRTVFRSSMGKDTTEALLVLKSKGGACFENTFADNVLTKCKAATKNSL